AAARRRLLSVARAQPVRRCSRRRGARARPGDRTFPRAEFAHADPGRRRQRRRRSPRAAHSLGRGRRRAGSFRGPAACGRRGGRRRSRSGQAAARRPHPGRQPHLGEAAAARGFLPGGSVFWHAGSRRRRRDPAGARRAGFGSRRSHLGDAGRRHPAGDGGASRQGAHRFIPRDGGHPLVESAALGHLRGHAQAHRRSCRLDRRSRAGRPRRQDPRGGSSDPRARWLRELPASAPDRAAAAMLVLCGIAAASALGIGGSRADPVSDDFAMKSTLQTRLAYVITGDSDVDATSKAGLQGLTLFLAQRTALEAGEPIGIDIGRDELAFFPLIYWPVMPNAARPAAEALARADAYMKQGGTILFDTRDAVAAPAGPGGEGRGPGMQALRTILSSLDIPELEPVPRDHVLTKTLFLLRDFPGRFNFGQLWVEAMPAEREDEPRRPARGGDGVSSILITSNDLAGAWAIQPDGQPMLPLVPGDPRQREFAFRAGVNIVMYTLTGNYKA